MIDIIFNNFVNVVGVIILFTLTNDVKNYIVEDLIHDDLFVTEFKEHHHKYFNQKCKNFLIKGFFICIFISFIFSYALGNASCDEVDQVTQICESYDEESSFSPTTIQRIGLFTTVFSYTFIMVLITAFEGNKKHKLNISDSLKVNDILENK